jgi:hypothetical protein
MASLRRLLEEAGCRDLGTQATAHHLGITPVLSSRTRRAALAETPIEALLRAPGPSPLRRVVEAAGRRGAGEAATAGAERAIAAFEALIEEEAGSRRTLDSMLVDLGSDRASFEAQRRQEIFKAYTEFEGLSIDALSLTLLVGPSDDGEHVDAVFLFGAFGLERLRAGAPFNFTRNEAITASGPAHTDRSEADSRSLLLEQFCSTPAPMRTVPLPDGGGFRYELGDTETGSEGRVDLVLQEYNKRALPRVRPLGRGPMAYHFTTSYPVKQLVFDVRIHEDVMPRVTPELFAYHAVGEGPARLGDPTRDGDLRRPSGELVVAQGGLALTEGSPLPRHREILEHAFAELGSGPDRYVTVAHRISFPMPWIQTIIGWVEEGHRRMPVPVQ